MTQTSIKNKFSFIDLFAGIGGFRIGLERNGGECIGFSEINQDAINTYCTNFKETSSSNFGDITKINNLPEHDLLTAGVPCQSWSIAGKNLGFDDDRGQLWNDTIFLLNKSHPKAFIFENVKGLSDPRNKEALDYILDRIKKAGYHAKYYILNSYDYGVLQNRVRIYIIGFKKKKYLDNFILPDIIRHNKKLGDIIEDAHIDATFQKQIINSNDLFGSRMPKGRTRFQKHNELNDFFLFNDIRDGHTTIHSWDLQVTSDREKHICKLLLKNRRKKLYGDFDGNPLSVKDFQNLDQTITTGELNKLVRKGILKMIETGFKIVKQVNLNSSEQEIINHSNNGIIKLDNLKKSKKLKIKKITFSKVLSDLKKKGAIECIEVKYDFKYSKISSGIAGINRIYLPSSDIFSTLVASDSSDFIALKNIQANNPETYKKLFIKEIYNKGLYRKITKEEACLIQGLPPEYELPKTRARWMKLIGNSVSSPVIENIGRAIIATGVFND